MVTWTGVYLAATPGVEAGDNATLRLDNANRPQPDILLRIDRAHGGRSFIAPDDYLVGANDLAGLLAVLQQGLASPEHAAFIHTLSAT